MTEQSDELRRYLDYEQRIRIEPNPHLVEDLCSRMDLLWFEMSKAERAWINARGEMKP